MSNIIVNHVMYNEVSSASVYVMLSCPQRIVKMNKTEDDELEAEALTQVEVSQMQGQAA